MSAKTRVRERSCMATRYPIVGDSQHNSQTKMNKALIVPSVLAIVVALGCGGGPVPLPEAEAPLADAAIRIPAEAPYDLWSWVAFPDSVCGTGTSTGIGINPHAGSSDVVIWFRG